MEEKEFAALVNSLEGYAREHPGAYKLRIALLAALGYVYLIGIVLVVLLLVAVVVYSASLNWLVIKFLLVPLGVAAIVLRSLWVEFPEPDGHEFWPAFLHRANHEAEPPKEVFNEMLAALRQPLSLIKAQLWFSQSLTNKHDYDETHPALGDRLEAMGYSDIRTTEYLEPFLKADEQVGDDYFLQTIPSDFLASKNRSGRHS